MKTRVSLVILLLLSFAVSAQKIRLIGGETKQLKGIDRIAVQVICDSVFVGAGIPEAVFVETRKVQWDSKEAGKGDAWVNHWNDSKTKLYGPTFQYQFKKNAGINVDMNAPYTLLLKTRQIEPGWNGGPMGGPAFIISDLLVVDSSDFSKIIAQFQMPRVKGKDKTGGDFEMGRRIQEAYANAGTLVGTYFKENIR